MYQIISYPIEKQLKGTIFKSTYFTKMLFLILDIQMGQGVTQSHHLVSIQNKIKLPVCYLNM